MPLNLDEVNLFSGMKITKGDIVVYSSDFNGSHEKSDVDMNDWQRISDEGGISVILAHKGRHGKNTPHLQDFAEYLTEKLGKVVYYYEESITPAAIKYVGALQPGDIAIMGNTRIHEDEEKNDPVLAQHFANLALKNDPNARVVIGGPGKAHRKNASNYGIQDYVRAFAAPSLVREMKSLEPWAGKSKKYSVAVIGGEKGEKIKDGLIGFVENYDAVVPGGIVLNTILLYQGKKIGKSVIEDDGKTFEKYVVNVLKSDNAHKLCVPKVVMVAKKTESGFEDEKWIRINNEGVPDEYMIVDFILPDSAIAALNMAESEGGRLVVAGTPTIVKEGFKVASDTIVDYANRGSINALIMGGETHTELKTKPAVKSVSVGGAGLYYAANGTTPVWEKLKENKGKFAE